MESKGVSTLRNAVIVIGIVFCFIGVSSCKKRVPPQADMSEVANTTMTVDVTNEIPEIQVIEEFNDETAAAKVEEPEVASVSAEADAGVFIPPSPQDIQTALKNAGYYEGKVDGIIGPKSKEAIMSFQKDNSLAADGKVGAKTWAKLGKFLKQE